MIVIVVHFNETVSKIKVNVLTLFRNPTDFERIDSGGHFLPRNSACAPRHLATCTRCVEIDGYPQFCRATVSWKAFSSTNMGGSQSVEIPGGGSEGYHVLRVSFGAPTACCQLSIPYEALGDPAQCVDKRPGMSSAASNGKTHPYRGKFGLVMDISTPRCSLILLLGIQPYLIEKRGLIVVKLAKSCVSCSPQDDSYHILVLSDTVDVHLITFYITLTNVKLEIAAVS